MLIAHRGNDNHNYKENSEEGIIFSLSKSYIDGIECDIRLTKDNEIVLSHNTLIDFKSNGSGFIHDLTLDELLSYKFNNGEIPVLKKLLSKIQTDKILLLEIKEEREKMEEKWIKSLEDILKKYPYLNIYLCSFNYKLISKIKETIKVPIGIIIGYKMNKEKDIKPFDFVMYQYKSFIYSHKETFIWTVNTKDIFNKYKNKAKYIITDKAYEFV